MSSRRWRPLRTIGTTIETYQLVHQLGVGAVYQPDHLAGDDLAASTKMLNRVRGAGKPVDRSRYR